jgi:hypothetical protein
LPASPHRLGQHPASARAHLLLAASLLAGSLVAGMAGLVPAARAGSATASSIWNKTNALARARQQLPPGAVVTGEHCQEVEVGIGNIRYLCTVEFSPAPAVSTPSSTP